MRLPVFLLPEASADDRTVVLAGREGHHAADVRRLRVGEPVEVTDGRGLRMRCRVGSVGRSQVSLDVDRAEREPPGLPRVTVAQALIKQDAADRALAAMTEVGVDAVLPWTAQRSVVTWDASRVDRGLRRWRAAAAEAAKQSRRSWVPDVPEPVSTADLASMSPTVDLVLLLDSAAAQPVGGVDLNDVASLLVVVGPEGGVTDEEARTLRGAGAVAVHLGPTVLRSATAGTAAVAALLSHSPRWLSRQQEAPAG